MNWQEPWIDFSEMHHSLLWVLSLCSLFTISFFILKIINAGVILKLREKWCGDSVATGQMARKWRGRPCLTSKAHVLPSTGCLLLFAVVVSGPRPWDTDRARRSWLCFLLRLCSSEAFPSKADLSSSDPKKLSPRGPWFHTRTAWDSRGRRAN